MMDILGAIGLLLVFLFGLLFAFCSACHLACFWAGASLAIGHAVGLLLSRKGCVVNDHRTKASNE